MDSKVKVTDNIYQKCNFMVSACRSTVCCRRPFGECAMLKACDACTDMGRPVIAHCTNSEDLLQTCIVIAATKLRVRADSLRYLWLIRVQICVH